MRIHNLNPAYLKNHNSVTDYYPRYGTATLADIFKYFLLYKDGERGYESQEEDSGYVRVPHQAGG